MTDKLDKVFDPFPSDPAIVAMGKSDKTSFNPDVSPFTPMSELGTWRVIAAEYTGKAVAVMQTADSKLLVCTSPSFNSKCRHASVPCLDWDNVKMTPAQGSQPDSGLDNTDQSSEDRDKRERVAQWSEDAAKHTVELSEQYNGMASDLYESTTFQPQVPEWAMTESGQSPMWSGPGGETHLVQWSPVTNDPAASAAQSPAYNNLHITVEYHNPAPDSYASPSYCDDQSFLSPIGVEESSSSTVIGRSGFGNDPLFVCPGPVVSDDSWSMGLGMDLSRLSLNTYDTSFESVRPPVVDPVDQSKKREEFKNTVLSNIGLVKEPSAEDKIRLDFKQQILSNIEQIEAANLDKDAKKRDDFKSKVLSNLNR